MTLAKNILEKMKSKKEGSMNSLGQMSKTAMGIVEKLMKETYGKDDKMQEKMCNEMMKLAKMDDKYANDFMEYMDEMASKYEVKDMMDKDEAKKKKDEEEDDDDDDMENDDDMEGDDDDDMESDEKKHKKKKK